MEWIVARWVTFVATILVAGVCAIGLAVIPRAAIDDVTRRATARDAARVGIGACLALIPASFLRLADQVMALQSPGDPMFTGLDALLSSTTWGTGFLWQSAAMLLALAALVVASRTPQATWVWVLATIGAVGLCATPAMQGHAIGNENYTLIAVSADVAHVLGAGLWLGGIGVIGFLGVTLPNADGVVVRDRGALADARLRLLVPLIPPVALTGAALLLASGVISTVLGLRELNELWTTAWGRYVSIKVVLVGCITALGALNWRRLGRRLDALTGVKALRKSLLIELGIAALVLMVTALLVVTGLPGE